jgi:membrane associated rhomboid family serine protease
MIPIRDDAPKSGTPYVTYVLIALNTFVFLFEWSLSPYSLGQFIFQFGVIPAEFTSRFQLCDSLPLFSSMFLHGSWLHLIGDMLALWIFGDNIEDHLGSFRYLVLYLTSGIVASILHIAFNQNSTIPSVGASGAIAGVMGAYFLLFPRARVLTFIPLPFFWVWLPAWIVLGYWFLGEFLSGAATSIASTANTSTAGGVAVWAHVGGFIAGITLIKLFPAKRPRFSFEH